MKNAPEESNLLEDVLSESARRVDSLGPMLRAVRARRRRRQAIPALVVMLAAGLVWTWLNPAFRFGGDGEHEHAASARRVLAPTPTALFARINSFGLAESERIASRPDQVLLAHVTTNPERVVRVSDRELFALAGGRGVGLFRFDDRAELLIARGIDRRAIY